MLNDPAKQLARQCAATWKRGPEFAGWLDYLERDCEDEDAAFATYRALRLTETSMTLERFHSDYCKRTQHTASNTHENCAACDGSKTFRYPAANRRGVIVGYAAACPQPQPHGWDDTQEGYIGHAWDCYTADCVTGGVDPISHDWFVQRLTAATGHEPHIQC